VWICVIGETLPLDLVVHRLYELRLTLSTPLGVAYGKAELVEEENAV
jgi:hypothetical protein